MNKKKPTYIYIAVCRVFENFVIKFGKKQIKEDLQLRHLTKNVSELRDLFTFAPYLCLRVHTNVRTSSDKKRRNNQIEKQKRSIKTI